MNGLHHVTAMSGSAQKNVDFYAGVLGLRLIKVTVNFDDPTVYHLYYADAVGTPGSVMTFFPWENASPGKIGNGQASVTQFTIPVGSLDFWVDRLSAEAVRWDRTDRFGSRRLGLVDPDGLGLELVEASPDARFVTWGASPVPAEHQIRGFYGVVLALDEEAGSAGILRDLFGWREGRREGDFVEFVYGEGGASRTVEFQVQPGAARGRMGTGVVHHVAFRAEDLAQEEVYQTRLWEHRVAATEVKNREYFQSVYYREPGGVLYEIATDTPGFAIDEPLEHLGERLCLPPWFEEARPRIEARLPRIVTTTGVELP